MTFSTNFYAKINLYPLDSTFTYVSSGLTQSATLAIKVHGVVVHTRK